MFFFKFNETKQNIGLEKNDIEMHIKIKKN